MSEVKRYDFIHTPLGSFIKTNDNGKYVEYSDYEKLKAQLERAETQNHEIIKYCMKHDKFQFMWAATILSIIFDCDFRDASDKAREYFKEKEQK